MKLFSTNLAHAFGVTPFSGTVSIRVKATLDVGPVLRRFLTRADDFFDDPFFLTLADELVRREVAE